MICQDSYSVNGDLIDGVYKQVLGENRRVVYNIALFFGNRV